MSSTLRSRAGGLRELQGLGEVWLLVRVCSFAAAVPLLMRLPLPRVAALLTCGARYRPPPRVAALLTCGARYRPPPRVAALLTRAPDRPPRRRPTSPEIERLERLVAIAPRVAGPLVRSGCLTRGVTLFWFLRRAGLDVELRFGLDPRDADDTDGHCWLSIDGEPFLEKRDPRPRFAEVYRLPLRVA